MCAPELAAFNQRMGYTLVYVSEGVQVAPLNSLEVAMPHGARVEVEKCLARLRHDLQPLPPRERPELRREPEEIELCWICL